MFSGLPSHWFLCQTHFPFMRDFAKKKKGGLRDCLCWLLGQARFSGPVALNGEPSAPECWQTLQKAPVGSKNSSCVSDFADKSPQLFRIIEIISTTWNGSVAPWIAQSFLQITRVWSAGGCVATSKASKHHFLYWIHYSPLRLDVASSQRENWPALALNLDRCVAARQRLLR